MALWKKKSLCLIFMNFHCCWIYCPRPFATSQCPSQKLSSRGALASRKTHRNSFFKCLDGEFKVRERRSGCVNSECIELCHFPLASPWMDARKTPSKIDLYDVRRRPWWEKRSRLSSVSVQWGLISLCVFLRQKKKHVCWKRFSQHHDLATFSKYSHYFLVEMGFKGL